MKSRIHKIIWTDWPALFAAYGIPIFWLVYFIFPYIRKGAQPYAPYATALAASASAILIVILGWRVMRIKRLFRNGVVTKGRITGILIARERGRLEYAYELNDQRFDSWSPVHKNKTTLSLVRGEAVEILVDPKQPRRAIVQKLYV